jgi:hypothetical protein
MPCDTSPTVVEFSLRVERKLHNHLKNDFHGFIIYRMGVACRQEFSLFAYKQKIPHFNHTNVNLICQKYFYCIRLFKILLAYPTDSATRQQGESAL